MNGLDFEQTILGPDCQRVLRAYAEAIAALPKTPELDDATESEAGHEPRRSHWVLRLREVQGVAAGRLAPIHGRLIALGLLQFQLDGRTIGVAYQLTVEGRQALKHAPAEESFDLDVSLLRSA